mgnify:CR=1 FL=1
MRKMLATPQNNLMGSVWLEVLGGAIANQKQLSSALAGTAPFTTVFPNSGVGDGMEMIARLKYVNGLRVAGNFCRTF